MVYWLVIVLFSPQSNGEDGTVVIPVPYTSQEMCIEAAREADYGVCIPQPSTDKKYWTPALNDDY